jgi:hypothetical protein
LVTGSREIRNESLGSVPESVVFSKAMDKIGTQAFFQTLDEVFRD